MGTQTVQGYIGVAGRSEEFNVSNPTIPNWINAGDQRDVILAFNNNDLLFGGLGRDLIVGYLGDDTIYGDQSWDDETTSADANLAAAADLITGDSASSGSVSGGKDTIFAGGGNNYVNGEGGNDFILGGSGNEYLQGGSGNDALSGLAGDDILIGGTGTNAAQDAFINAQIGTSVTTAFNGLNDTAATATSTYADYSGQVALTNTGDDYLDGGAGNDSLYGQDGNDLLFGGDGNDFISGDTGFDYISGGAGNDQAYGGEGDDVMEGGAGVDFYVGDAGNDTLLGGEGNDVLSGAAGNDYVIGGQGYDLMYGGDGNDVFEIRKGDLEDIAFGEAGLDTAFFADRASTEVASRGVASNGYYTVVFTDGSYTSLSGVEYLAFTDTSLFIG